MDLRKSEEWSKKWQLPFNATKCKVMHFGYQNLQQTYHLNGHALESSHIEKDLGVTRRQFKVSHCQSSEKCKSDFRCYEKIIQHKRQNDNLYSIQSHS